MLFLAHDVIVIYSEIRNIKCILPIGQNDKDSNTYWVCTYLTNITAPTSKKFSFLCSKLL